MLVMSYEQAGLWVKFLQTQTNISQLVLCQLSSEWSNGGAICILKNATMTALTLFMASICGIVFYPGVSFFLAYMLK